MTRKGFTHDPQTENTNDINPKVQHEIGGFINLQHIGKDIITQGETYLSWGICFLKRGVQGSIKYKYY